MHQGVASDIYMMIITSNVSRIITSIVIILTIKKPSFYPRLSPNEIEIISEKANGT